jgi:hypothetical protein
VRLGGVLGQGVLSLCFNECPVLVPQTVKLNWGEKREAEAAELGLTVEVIGPNAHWGKRGWQTVRLPLPHLRSKSR